MTKIERNRIGLLGALTLFTLFVGLGSVPLFDRDEGAFAEATRYMLDSGNYLMTYLDGEPRYDKPILIYWCQAACAKVFGINALSMRLPSSIASVFWLLAVYLFVRQRRGDAEAFWASFLMLTTLQITIIMKAAIADALLNACIVIAMFAWYRYFETKEKMALRVAALAMGIGFLTKGPLAVIIPVVVALIHCLWERQGRRWLQAWKDPLAWLLFFGVIAPWFIWAIIDQGQAIIDAWNSHVLGRYTKTREGHGGSLVYFFIVLPLGFLPHTTLLFATLWKHAPHWLKRQPRPDAPTTDAAMADRSLVRFLLIWFGFVFVLFTLSSTQLPHYVIYGYTPLFILMARRIDNLPKRVWVLAPALCMFVGMAIIPFLIPLITPYIRDQFAVEVLANPMRDFGAAYFAVVIPITLLVLAVTFKPRGTEAARLMATAILLVLAVNFALVPAVGRIKQSPIVEAAAYAKKHDLDVKRHRMNDEPSFVFYRGALSARGTLEVGDVVLSKRYKLDRIAEYETLYFKNGVVLARLTALREPEKPK